MSSELVFGKLYFIWLFIDLFNDDFHRLPRFGQGVKKPGLRFRAYRRPARELSAGRFRSLAGYRIFH